MNGLLSLLIFLPVAGTLVVLFVPREKPSVIRWVTTLFAGAEFLLSVEMSMGQMVEDVMLSVNGLCPVYFYGRSGGNVPSPAEIVAEVRKHL